MFSFSLKDLGIVLRENTIFSFYTVPSNEVRRDRKQKAKLFEKILIMEPTVCKPLQSISTIRRPGPGELMDTYAPTQILGVWLCFGYWLQVTVILKRS
jgi:hypothetical protein